MTCRKSRQAKDEYATADVGAGGMSKVRESTARCGCCWYQIKIDVLGVVRRVCKCLGRKRCGLCGRCSDHCCKTGWTRPAVPGKRGPRG